MTFIGWIQILLYCAIVVALVVPLGSYMTRVFNGERTFLSPVLQPICILYALLLVWQGIPQTLGPYVEAMPLEGGKQTIAVGPVASQVAIKMLGTNGGGFFNANASHPFENPTALSNFVQMISIFAIGAALTNMFGRMVGDQRQGWAILAAMGVLFIAGVSVAYWAEAHGNG